jgi:hypothetical protein
MLVQMNQFELFKSFVINILDSKNIMEVSEFHELFEEFKNVNGTKLLNNLIIMKPILKDIQIDITISHKVKSD